jgi:alkylation response protein AidB-like acyl-CoA dehydrogenase
MRAARRAIAFELLGLGWAMVDLACDHAREREQFGRPIGAFQAVRHQLADAAVGLYGARALADESWVDDRVEVVLATKAEAVIATRTAARASQQVLAAMGFTAEHPFGALFRRALVLERVLGTATSCYERLAPLLRTGSNPAGSL